MPLLRHCFLLFVLLVVVHAAVDKIGTLGGPCNTIATSVPCRVVNTLCTDNVCRCAPTYRQENEKCVRNGGGSSLGRPCASTTDCSGEGEYCSSYARCMCMSTHIELNSLCRPVIYPGQSGCEDGRQCAKAFPGATCNKERVCQCPDGLTAEGQTCVHSSSLVPIVLADSLPLPLPIPFDLGRSNQRQHRTSQVYWADQRERQNLPSSVPPGGICSGDPDCNGYPHAYCSGTCMCRSGAFNAGSTCVESGVSTSGTCPANHVYVAEAGSCMMTARPGQPCQYSQQCSGNEIGAFCLRQVCQCIYGMMTLNNRCTFVDTNCTQRGTIWISELGECRPVVAPGARNCTYNKQCTEAYREAMCFLQQCTCPPLMPVAVDGTCGRNCSAGETYSGVLGRCIATVKPGDQCLYSSQCHALSPGMICDRGSCRCPNSQAWTGSACSTVCPRGYILNSKGLCNPGCRSNQVEYQGECLEQVNPGQNCKINAQCLGGSTCTSGLNCTCPTGMSSTNGLCKLAEARPLQSCINGELCTGGSFCSNGNCTCPVGTSVLNAQCVTPITVPPLSPCNPSVQCGGNSFCLAGICSCPQNQQPIQDQCQLPPAVSPGSRCPSGLERCIGGSTCIGSICTCPFGTVIRLGECQPIQQVTPGSPCDNQLLRCTGLSVCVFNRCECPSGMTIQGGACRIAPTVLAGSSCAGGERCGGNSVCINSVCTCPINTLNQNGMCRSPVSVPPQSSCANQEVCSGGSNCINFVCQCPPDTQIFGAQCVASSGSLGFCTNQIQCGGGSLCDTQRGVCICPTGKIAVGSVCVNTVGALETTNKDDSLLPAPPLSTCSDERPCTGGALCRNGFCHCEAGQIPVDDICQYVIAEPGTSCASGQTCSGNSYCIKGMCSCSSNERIANGACTNELITVGVGGDCRDLLSECGYGSVCQMGRCNCPDGWIVRSERCIIRRTALPGESCADGQECAQGTFCDDRSERAVCSCYAHDHIVVGKKCVEALRSPPGYPCSNREVCIGGSQCIDGTCQCEKHQTIIDRQCMMKPRVVPGGICGVKESICLGRSECDPVKRRCVCPRHFVIREGACEMAARVAPGKACRPSYDICQMGSRCIGNVCQCSAGQMPIGERCAPIPQVMPGGSCARGEICLDRAECREGRCVCLSGRIIRLDRCVVPPRVRPGMSCDEGDVCIGDSTCIRGICSCAENKIIRRDRCISRSHVRVGYLCHEEDTCSGNSTCINGVCTCAKGQIVRNDNCLVPPEVGPEERCDRGEICTGGSTCINFICTCTLGLVRRGDQCMTPAPAAPGMSCDRGERCVGGSTCIGGVCRCSGDQVIRSNFCTEPLTARPMEKKLNIRGGNGGTFVCNLDDDCTGGAFCNSKVCVCPGKLLMVDGKCRASTEKAKLSLARPGEPCTPLEKCSGDAICVQGLCRCPIGFRLDGLACKQSPFERVLPGERCSDTLICQNGAFCSENRCECPIGMVIIEAVCRPAAIVGPLASCTNGEICSGNSYCEKGVCFCPTDTVLHGNFCESVREAKRLRKIEEENRSNKSLITIITMPSGTRLPSTITTTTEMSPVVTRNLPFPMTTRSIWSPQTTAITAAPPTATMKARTTTDSTMTPEQIVTVTEPITLPPTIESITPPGVITFPLNVAKPGMQCDGELIVCSNGSSCIDGFCQCRVGLLRINSTCVTPETRTDAQCVSNNQCASGAECVEGRCHCPIGTELTRFGFCMPHSTVPPGADCVNGERCGGGSSCISRTCACPPGLSAIVNNICVPPSSGFRRRTDPIWLHDAPSINSLMVDEHVPITNQSATIILRNEPNNVQLGEPCVPNSSMICVAESECLDGICQCSSDSVQLGQRCVKRWTVQKSVVDPGRQCREDQDFCGGGAECIASLCHCQPGWVVHGSTCAQLIMGAGRECTTEANCAGGSVCKNGVCQCPSGLVQADAECVRGSGKAASPGASCLFDAAACTGGSFCRSGVCVCATGSAISNGQCVINTRYVAPGGACISGDPTLQCTGNSVCAGNAATQFCTCPSGEIVRNGQCVTQEFTANPGEPCIPTTTQCLGNSFCIGGLCSCTSNQLPMGNQCTTTRTTVYPNYACDASSMCVGNSMCIGGVCQCPPGQSPVNNQCQSTTSTVVGNPGTACDIYASSPTTCRGGAVCVRNICVCPSTLVIAGERCVPFAGAANPGESCAIEGIICQGGSTCVNNVCRCTFGFMPVGQLCVAVNNPPTTPQPSIILNPGETCDERCTPSTCLQRCGGGSICSDNICTCPAGYSAINGACVIATNSPTPPVIPTAYPSQQCVSRTLCLGGSSCILGICRCPSDQTPNPDTRSCVLSGSGAADIVNAPPGSPCSRLGYVCSGGSYCAPDGICRCPVDQTVANNTCIGVNAPSSANPGSPCTATTACLGDSTCVRNYCICGQFKLVNTQGRCVNVDQSDTKEVLPGSACPAASAPCQRNSVCENGYCICRATTINIGGSCVTTPTTSKPIGSSCIDSSECTSGAVCRNGNCLCPNGYRNQEGRCVPIDGVGGRVPIGGQCALESDCAGGAGCLNQRCACTDGKTASASGVCVLRQYSVPPGSWCSNEGGVTCHGGAECYRNTCSCPFGHIMINLQCSEAPVVLPGRSCNNGELCGGGSVCKSGVCTCPVTTTESGQLCQSQIAHAEPCDPNRCRLPNCFCSRDGAAIPGGLSAAETPQMVVLTFDDAVTDRTINIYKSLFDGRFKNPNGCPIKGTFFISHEWNNYDQTQWLYTNEHEIGVNSITHETLATEPVARWDAEMDGMRDALRTFSFVDTAEVVGVRAPQLSVGGESQFEMMRNRGFLYDNSMSANPGSRGRPFWPQTLDYSIAWNCEVKPCPVRSYPGIWTIPINQFYGYYLPEIEEHKRAAMVRAAMKVDDSPINVLGMLRENFRRAYESNRAPYVLTLNTDFLTVLPDNGAVTAIEQFLAEILNKTDVYVVTGRQAIEWVRQPTPLSSIRSFEPWACHRRLRADVQPCESSEPCRYDTRLANGVHSFRTCGSCPSQYPWLYDPTGKGNVRT